MDSAALLDLLGNENRRRILRLLARKPCYVTEISEYLGVSPKAVIDHLRRLEEAGLVESRTDDQRRKYFHISRNLRLEVSVSPYGFGMKSAYPASTSLDITTCRHISVNVEGERESLDDVTDLACELKRLEELESELSLAQRWVHGRMTDVLDRLSESVEIPGDSRIHAEILATIVDEPRGVHEISRAVDAPEPIVEDCLAALADRGLAVRSGDSWTVPEN